MPKKLNNIATNTQYYALQRSLPYPSVSFIQETGITLLQGKGMRIPNVGDIVLYDKENNKKELVYYTDYNAVVYPLDRYTPIGVVVIPQDFLAEESEARMMSLVEMNPATPETGSTNYNYMNWGGFSYDDSDYTYADIAGLENLSSKSQKQVNADGTESGSTNNWGYLPSDKFSGLANQADNTTYWDSSAPSSAMPSPYTTQWIKNPLYGQGSSGESFLADTNGKANTDVLIAAETLQTTWQTDDAIVSATSGARDYTGHFPPALCCRRFHTDGTSVGDWYLPAIGELAFLMPRWSIIQAALKQAKSVSKLVAPLHEYGSCWSSSEYSQYGTYGLDANIGYVNFYSKSSIVFVRAFALLPRI